MNNRPPCTHLTHVDILTDKTCSAQPIVICCHCDRWEHIPVTWQTNPAWGCCYWDPTQTPTRAHHP